MKMKTGRDGTEGFVPCSGICCGFGLVLIISSFINDTNIGLIISGSIFMVGGIFMIALVVFLDSIKWEITQTISHFHFSNSRRDCLV